MSEAKTTEVKTRALIVGATGLIGRQLVDLLASQERCEVHALARRDVAANNAVYTICDPQDWPDVIIQWQPDVFISALGTTWKQSGRSEAAFRAVDYDLVVSCAEAARKGGAKRAVIVSSVGADSGSRSFYLRTKGEAEDAIGKMGFEQLDIVRPGLLRGERGGDRRLGERLGIMASPLTDALMPSKWSRYRSIASADVASAIACILLQQAGLVQQVGLVQQAGLAHKSNIRVHHNDALHKWATVMGGKRR